MTIIRIIIIGRLLVVMMITIVMMTPIFYTGDDDSDDDDHSILHIDDWVNFDALLRRWLQVIPGYAFVDTFRWNFYCQYSILDIDDDDIIDCYIIDDWYDDTVMIFDGIAVLLPCPCCYHYTDVTTNSPIVDDDDINILCWAKYYYGKWWRYLKNGVDINLLWYCDSAIVIPSNTSISWYRYGVH